VYEGDRNIPFFSVFPIDSERGPRMALFLTFDFSAYFKYADFRRYPYSTAQELIGVGTESGNNQLYLKISPCNDEI